MDNLEYDAYVKDTLNLAKTMVIKFDEIGIRDNKSLERAGYPVNYVDRTTWRYYLNLNGDYHYTDTPMYVKSIDTGEMILFSKENLKIHLSTKRVYNDANSYQYRRLIEAYPAQFLLINGILNPIPMEESINASNYKILRYNKNLVLWNEEQLIPKVQKAIDAFVFKAFNNGYMNTDNLMIVQLVGQTYARIPADIMNIRWEAVGTRYVHDFHIWSRIGSYINIAPYKDVLDNYQKMWLYRNIEWIVRNIGSQHTFGKLIDNLLTHRRVPLASYRASKDTGKQLDELKPEPIFIRKNINLLNSYGTAVKYLSVKEVINKETDLARDNALLSEYAEEETISRIRTSIHTDVPTKLLESEMEDYTDRNSDSLLKTLLAEWYHLGYTNTYDTVIEIEEPKTGKIIKLDVKSSAVLFDYLLGLARGEVRRDIVHLYYSRASKIRRPSYDEVKQFFTNEYLEPELIHTILNQSTEFEKIINPETFFKKCSEIYSLKWNHNKIYAQFYDYMQWAQTKAACDFMYTTGYQAMSPFKTYDELLGFLELDISEYTKGELEDLAYSIFIKTTGWDINSSNSLRDTQKALLSLTAELSSYTIQLLNTMRDGADTIEYEGRFGLLRDPATAVANNSDKINATFGPDVIPNCSSNLFVEVPLTQNQEVIAEIGIYGIVDIDMANHIEEDQSSQLIGTAWEVSLKLEINESLTQ